jgi:hypothetical protein
MTFMRIASCALASFSKQVRYSVRTPSEASSRGALDFDVGSEDEVLQTLGLEDQFGPWFSIGCSCRILVV